MGKIGSTLMGIGIVVLIVAVIYFVGIHGLMSGDKVNIGPVDAEYGLGTELNYTVIEQLSFWEEQEPLECRVGMVLTAPDREVIVLVAEANMTKPNATSRHQYRGSVVFDEAGYWELNAHAKCRFPREKGSEWKFDYYQKGIMIGDWEGGLMLDN